MSHPSQHEIANSQNFFRGAAVVDRLLDRMKPGKEIREAQARTAAEKK